MTTTTKVTKGNTVKKLYTVISDGGNPEDLSLYTVKFRMVEKDDTTSVIVNDTETGIETHPLFEFTAAANDRITRNGHVVKEGNQIVVSSTGTLPTGLSASTRYFPVEITPNAFKLAETPNGAPIDITGAGSGTHSFYVVGSLQRDWQTVDVANAGEYFAWFKLFVGSEFQHVPYDGASWLVIVEQSY